MDSRNLWILLMLVAVNCKVIELEDNGVLYGESMVEVVQRLVREVNALKTDNQKLKVNDQKLKQETDKLKADDQKLKTETGKLKADDQKLKADNQKLKADNQKLTADSDQLKADNKELKAEVSRLKNNGHSRFSVADQQWQSLHMAAAAACRASTALGGHGPWGNAVFPRTKGHTCDQVCNNTKVYTECDASLSIMGGMGRVKAVNQAAGSFYNYHCSSAGAGQPHEVVVADSAVTDIGGYYGYCCCRKP